MPAISIDTFFACSLMVLLVLSAMAATASLLYQPISSSPGDEAFARYGEIAKYILLNTGKPADWGKNSQIVLEEFGLADAEAANPYTLDMDKVSRLNGENLHALSYAQIYTSLKIPDVAFRIEVKPLFETVVNLTATYEVGETIYEFEVETVRSGVNVPAELRFYVVAGNFLQDLGVYSSNGEARLNVTIPEGVNGPALLVVLAKSQYNAKIVSFAVYAFAHNSQNPTSKDSFLKLSPLNYTLTVVSNNPSLTLSQAYALTFNYFQTLEQRTSQNQSATFTIPRFLDASPIVLVATGRNSTQFFVEWTVYPQIPVAIGISPADSMSLADVYAYTYLVSINSALYRCTVWLGGPKQ